MPGGQSLVRAWAKATGQEEAGRGAGAGAAGPGGTETGEGGAGAGAVSATCGDSNPPCEYQGALWLSRVYQWLTTCWAPYVKAPPLIVEEVRLPPFLLQR